MVNKNIDFYDVAGAASEQEFIQELIDLIDAIKVLPQRQQAIIALRYAGYTQKSVTELLGVSRFTVWGDENKALATLRNNLGGLLDCSSRGG